MVKKIIALLILATFITSCTNNPEKEKKVKKQFTTYTVTTGNLSNIWKFVGYTTGQKEVMLATKVPGRIVYLAKNVWDKVYAWEVLARLDSTEAKTWYSTANSIVNSLYNLRNQTAKAYDWQIESLKAKIKQAEIWVKWMETWLKDTKEITTSQLETAKTGLEQAKLWLETAQKNLEETKKSLEVKYQNILDWGKTAITQSIILDRNIIDFADKLLWMTEDNKRYNDRFESFLWAKNSRQLKETKLIFLDAKKEVDKYNEFYKKNIENKDNIWEDKIVEWLKIAEKTAEKQKELLKWLYDVMENSIPSVSFPLSVINEYKKNISQFGSQVESSLLTVSWNYIVWIKWTLQNLKDFEASKQKAITLLEKQVELAKASLNTAQKKYEQYLNMGNWKINEVKTKKDVALEQLQEAKAWLKALIAKKEASLREIDAKIAEALWWKKKANVMINNWIVVSNINWIVTQKMAEVGQVINAWMPIYIVSDNSVLKVKTSIPYNFYKNLKLGDKVNIAIEWVNKAVIAKVSMLSKKANPFTKKYDIEVKINNKDYKYPNWAMTIIILKQKNNKNKVGNAIIPVNSIVSKFWVPAVYVIEKNKAVLKNIKIIKLWQTKAEVTWIKSLDKIIVDWKENIYDGEILEK